MTQLQNFQEKLRKKTEYEGFSVGQILIFNNETGEGFILSAKGEVIKFIYAAICEKSNNTVLAAGKIALFKTFEVKGSVVNSELGYTEYETSLRAYHIIVKNYKVA